MGQSQTPPPEPASWHALGSESILQQLGTDSSSGLSRGEAAKRLQRHGSNQLPREPARRPLGILWGQIRSTLVLILLAAAVLSSLLGDFKDSAVILAIVLLNTLLGFRQEYRAEKALEALRNLAQPSVRVKRDGSVLQVSSQDLVPGDILLLEAGAVVAADARLLECVHLESDEAVLTGESGPVEKGVEPVPQETVLAERKNMVFQATTVTSGRGAAVVTSTGRETELGRIAALMQAVPAERSPLHRRMDLLGKVISLAALALVSLVFGFGWMRGESLRLLFLTSVSLAVAVVPEGLPAVVTIALSLGTERMLKRQALIRRLPAVETLGSTTVICSDKTGTLTQNRMTVVSLVTAGGKLPLGGPISEPLSLEQVLLLASGALCNNMASDSIEEGPAAGDPTEMAWLAGASDQGISREELLDFLPRLDEVSFDSTRKRMTTIHQAGRYPADLFRGLHAKDWNGVGFLTLTKGSVESILSCSLSFLDETAVRPLSESDRKRFLQAGEELAGQGLRVLGAGYRLLPSELPPTQEALEKDLTFLGIVALTDPPRPEVPDAVARCKSAGIRPVMITGDHLLTATSVATSLGISREGDRWVTGAEMEGMSQEELGSAVGRISVFARVTPADKLRIVEALQENGQIVAMTGDGVNDAPALKRADIGIAMGITGTDVSKEAAEMVLLDDHFATIVNAVEEGRVIYDNIRKFVKFLLSCNSGELWVMLVAPMLGMPLPLLPLQILWMNLLTDGFPALALGLEPGEKRVMERPPRPPQESLFAGSVGRDIVSMGLLLALLSLVVGYSAWLKSSPTWQTMLFTTLTFCQLSLALGFRSDRDTLFQIGLRSNPFMVLAVLSSILLQLAVVYFPFLQWLFGTSPLSTVELLTCILISGLVLALVEGQKILRRQAGDHVDPAR